LWRRVNNRPESENAIMYKQWLEGPPEDHVSGERPAITAFNNAIRNVPFE
jgi:hypothetical protein